MKPPFLVLALLCLLPAGAGAAAEPVLTPHPVTLTFYVTGMECGTCTTLITQSVSEVKGVTDVSPEIIGGYANVSFDPRLSSAHQIAQAIADTTPVHGKPFVPTMKVVVPGYAKDGNAARVDAAFARQKEWVDVELVEKAKGEFVIYFNPLKLDGKKTGPQGWDPGCLWHALQDPAPKGLGLAFTLAYEAPYTPLPKVVTDKK